VAEFVPWSPLGTTPFWCVSVSVAIVAWSESTNEWVPMELDEDFNFARVRNLLGTCFSKYRHGWGYYLHPLLFGFSLTITQHFSLKIYPLYY
jgi:hypothetical protein